MSKSKFPAADLALAIRVARAMAEGPYIADFEFLALMGFDRTTYLSLVSELEAGTRPIGNLASVVGLGLLNATEFPHKNDKLLEQTLGVSILALRDVYSRWRKYRRPPRIVLALLRAGPVIVQGLCYRVINYSNPAGSGWFCEVWSGERWVDPFDHPDLEDRPDLEVLEAAPLATRAQLANLLTKWEVPPLYNHFSRGKKRRDRRR